MDAIEAIKTRRSVKHYDSQYIIPQSEVNELLNTAIQAPTSFNIQHWRIVQVIDKNLRQEIRNVAWDQAQITDASLLFVICADINAWNNNPSQYWVNAPVEARDLVVPMIQPFYEGNKQLQRDEAVRSVGMIAQTMMITAKSMGYDSCPMIGFNSEQVAKIINLPEDYVLGMLLSIGRAVKPAWPKPGQLKLEDILIKDKF